MVLYLHDYKIARRSFTAFDEALIGTIEYMKDCRDGQPKDVPRERQLTALWKKASQAVSPLDPDISDACFGKGAGWTDPNAWAQARKKGQKISIEDMPNARRVLNAKRQASMARVEIPAWFPVAGVAFAGVTVLFLMYLLLGPTLAPEKKNIFDVLMAFCASASGAFLGGSAVASGRIPFLKDSPIAFSAAGGIGIFIVVYLVLHYAS